MRVDENGDRWSDNGIYMGNARWGQGMSPLGERWKAFRDWYNQQRTLAGQAYQSWSHQKGCVQMKAAAKRLYDLQILYEENRARCRANEFPEWHPADWSELPMGLTKEDRAAYVRGELQAKAGTSDLHVELDRLGRERAPTQATGSQGAIDFGGDDVDGHDLF